MHPSNEIKGIKDDVLAGKRIVLGIAGSIAAVETVKLARELIRRGAEVYPVLSPAATRLIHPDSLGFATGKRPITELTGAVEHVALCGDVKGHADLLLIAPSTANTISKIACGIDDTPVTTFASTALGTGIPVMIAPAMHATMYDNPAVIGNVERLKKMGVEFIEPKFEEKKAKMADIMQIASAVVRRIGRRDFEGKRVLVIAGPTSEAIDDMRVISNRSSGRTGIALANEAYERGADVKLLLGKGSAEPPEWIDTEYFTSVESLIGMLDELDYDVILVPAAISDYTPERHEGKIPSGRRELVIKLRPTPKVIEHIRENYDGILVAFKAEAVESTEELIKRAERRASEVGAEIIVANRLSDVGPESTKAFIIKGKQVRGFEGSREELARAILDELFSD